MSQSSAYPIFLGRAIALQFDLIWNRTEERDHVQEQCSKFAKHMVKSLPSAGTLLPEEWFEGKKY